MDKIFLDYRRESIVDPPSNAGDMMGADLLPLISVIMAISLFNATCLKVAKRAGPPQHAKSGVRPGGPN